MKTYLRSQIRQRLQQMTHIQYREQSAKIAQTLLQHNAITEGKTIALTISNRPEVDTLQIIEALWALGKQVAVPRCIPKSRTMDFYVLTSFEQLECVYMNIREPIPALTTYVDKTQIDCIIVPGIVFDRAGYRIGFGGGYYDRYLPNCSAYKISLAFDMQVIEHVPREQHDIPTNCIITPTAQIVCGNE